VQNILLVLILTLIQQIYENNNPLENGFIINKKKQYHTMETRDKTTVDRVKGIHVLGDQSRTQSRIKVLL